MNGTDSDVLIALGNPALNNELRELLARRGISCRSSASVTFARDELLRFHYAACLVDHETLPELRETLEALGDVHVVYMHPNPSQPITDFELGAVVAETDSEATLVERLRTGLEQVRLRRENEYLREQVEQLRIPSFLGVGNALRRVKLSCRQAMLEQGNLLFVGERGTGKPYLARAIHAPGRKTHRIHCGILTEAAAVEQIFDQGTPRFHSALLDNEFLLLEEISSLSPEIQRRLVEAADNVGRGIRVLATAESVSKNLLHWTRHWRHVVVPALRERTEDIVPAAEHFLEDACLQLSRTVPTLSDDAVALLEGYAWPGNFVELRNVIDHALSVSVAPELTAADLQSWLSSAEHEETAVGPSLREMERQLIEATFARCAGNRELTAKTLQIGLRTLSGKLREYGYPPRGGPGSKRQGNRAA